MSWRSESSDFDCLNAKTLGLPTKLPLAPRHHCSPTEEVTNTTYPAESLERVNSTVQPDGPRICDRIAWVKYAPNGVSNILTHLLSGRLLGRRGSYTCT